jgi:hypothetical protein
MQANVYTREKKAHRTNMLLKVLNVELLEFLAVFNV